MKLEGLYLWEITLENGDGESLNILTARNSHEAALSKARNFLKRHRGKYPKASPRDVKFHGTIDC